MDRRAFLGALGMLAAPLSAAAQQSGKVPHLGYLSSSPSDAFAAAFKQGLRELGYVEAQNIHICRICS